MPDIQPGPTRADAAGLADAVKTAYAAWTKGSATRLLAARELARVEAAGLPAGFHTAAAEVFRGYPRPAP